MEMKRNEKKINQRNEMKRKEIKNMIDRKTI